MAKKPYIVIDIKKSILSQRTTWSRTHIMITLLYNALYSH